MDDEIIDITKLRYVLYARKSTTDETRQVRSIQDQITECQALARRLGLNVVTVLQETKSAKKPNQRPVFNQMLKDIRGGKYDAILAWNPDRLARNMLEGGMLIDMVDQELIKDLKFVTHYFTRDANGKMLLGMAFVLSKQYSDDLSQKVTRGVRRSFEEGKSAIPKHGYFRTEEGYYKPDGKNFELASNGWNMRSNGESLENIAEYMNKNGYGRKVKKSGKLIKMSAKILTDLFKDPFYYGVLVQAKQTVDLRQLYVFEAATTEEIYNQVQELGTRRLKPFNTRRGMTFYPFKAMVRCFYCSRNMVVGPSTGSSGKKYLNFRCDTDGCTRAKKSIRVNVLLKWLYSFLENGLGLTEEDYQEYYNGLSQLTDEKRQKIKIELHSQEGSLKRVESEIKEIALGLVKQTNPTVKQVNEERIAELEEEKENLIQSIQALKSQLKDPQQDQLSLEQFLNLSKQAGVKVQSASAIIKDQICREIFLNWTLDEEKVASYQLKPPFDEMLKTRQVSTSRGQEN